jgi:hypothetical protein
MDGDWGLNTICDMIITDRIGCDTLWMDHDSTSIDRLKIFFFADSVLVSRREQPLL